MLTQYGMNKNLKPNLIIAGATKCGTTSIYKYLNQHPDISFCEPKEPNYFIKKYLLNVNPKDRIIKSILKSSILNEKEYFKLFNGLKKFKYRGEASVQYLFHHKISAKEIALSLDQPKIIIVLRNPVDRAVSNWKYIDIDQQNFETALGNESNLKKNGFSSFFLYKSQGFYYESVKCYFEYFENVKVLIYEEFKESPRKCLDEITDFLEIDRYDFNTSVIYNKSKQNYIGRNSFFKKIYTKAKIRKLIKSVDEKILFKTLIKFFYKEKKINNLNLRNKLIDDYMSDIRKLENLIGKNLSKWYNQ